MNKNLDHTKYDTYGCPVIKGQSVTWSQNIRYYLSVDFNAMHHRKNLKFDKSSTKIQYHDTYQSRYKPSCYDTKGKAQFK